MKRNREPDKAKKKKGEWSRSRKGTQMTCGNCCEPNHNLRSCYKERKKTNVCEYKIEASTQESTFRSQAETREFEPYGLDVENEEDPPLRPMMICESELRAEKLKTKLFQLVQEKFNLLEITLVHQCQLIYLILRSKIHKRRRSYLCWTCADESKKEKNQDDGVKGRGQPAPNDGSSQFIFYVNFLLMLMVNFNWLKNNTANSLGIVHED
ncbi:hypothetical protein H5410_003089 [Solanum commersonii]|uniref:Uncharacterized protein n=1 Tax=Solanum commersonii TaxID=4109 RepID=A0A9J6B413_SOLCO|nr:hypothetical protein H5410_003089 [Solanum commersonii]